MQQKQTWIREPFNSISHFVGAILSIAGLITLLALARGRPWHSAAFAVYGASLILLYSASALYHSLPVSERHLIALQRFDHSAIFVLIAGTYTPVCMALGGSWGRGLLIAEYSMAVLGILSVILFGGKPEWLRVLLYIVMGWLALIALDPLRTVLPAPALAWLVAGGLLYSIGTIFYAVNRPRLWPGKFSAHELWHVFVLGGSACHFILMLFLV